MAVLIEDGDYFIDLCKGCKWNYFSVSIPVLEETCKGLEQDIEVYTRLAEEVKYCCDHLTSQGWRGDSRDQFVRNYEVWYADSTAFINDLTTLHKILCETLERAEDLNQEALSLPRLLGGGVEVETKIS